MTEMTELKPCPFCGVMPHIYWEAWTDISPDAGVWKLEANHKDSCYITHINGTNISGRSSARRLSQLVEWWNHREELFGNSEQLPSAQPERKKGRWIDMDDHVMCSCCGATHYGSDKNFCPNCGAEMRGEKDG